MSLPSIDPNAPKKPTNLSINRDLLTAAKELDINLSRTLEQQRLLLVRQARQRQWLQQNQPALECYNQRIDHQGAFRVTPRNDLGDPERHVGG